MKMGGGNLRRRYPFYARIVTLLLFVLGVLVASGSVHAWTVVRFLGSRGFDDGGYRDPVFSNGLTYYFFDVPFFRMLLGYLLAVSIFAVLIFWLSSRFWALRDLFLAPGGPDSVSFELRDLDLAGTLGAGFVRIGGAIFLLALAVRFYLSRYDLLFEDHGSLVGIDWVAENLTLPLIWLKILAALACAVFLLGRRWQLLLLLPAVLILAGILPSIVTAAYVRPSEITIQRPIKLIDTVDLEGGPGTSFCSL
jgi:Uncharacterized conserved protein